MPLVAHNRLPAFDKLREDGHEVLTPADARRQDVRKLHIGLLNMMPDAALQATERQFMHLLGGADIAAQVYVYPFSLPELDRGAAAEDHIRKHYFAFEQLANDGLDALIISGANVIRPQLAEEPFWEPLAEVVHWARTTVASIFCSCLATHALAKLCHGIDRRLLPRKQWGVFHHRLTRPGHPLLCNVAPCFDAPHSRYNDISRQQLEEAGCHVLAESEVGVHLAVSPDQIRIVYFQGHPEYDAVSLLKECKREYRRYVAGERQTFPRLPDNYLAAPGLAIANELLERLDVNGRERAPEFPEQKLTPHCRNTWLEAGKAIVDNWLGLVCRLASLDRRQQFMAGVDPDDPLQLRTRQPSYERT